MKFKKTPKELPGIDWNILFWKSTSLGDFLLKSSFGRKFHHYTQFFIVEAERLITNEKLWRKSVYFLKSGWNLLFNEVDAGISGQIIDDFKGTLSVVDSVVSLIDFPMGSGC